LKCTGRHSPLQFPSSPGSPANAQWPNCTGVAPTCLLSDCPHGDAGHQHERRSTQLLAILIVESMLIIHPSLRDASYPKLRGLSVRLARHRGSRISQAPGSASTSRRPKTSDASHAYCSDVHALSGHPRRASSTRRSHATQIVTSASLQKLRQLHPPIVPGASHRGHVGLAQHQSPMREGPPLAILIRLGAPQRRIATTATPTGTISNCSVRIACGWLPPGVCGDSRPVKA